MHGIVSLLDPPHYAKVEGLWDVLGLDCSVLGIQVTPRPHFSWHVAQDYNIKVLGPLLAKIASQARPFKVRTTGIGLFTGSKPAVFIPVVKDALLLKFHEIMWKMAKDASIFPSPYYAPPVWMPHITLAYGETNWQRLSCVLEKLTYHPFNWEIVVDHIAVSYENEDRMGNKSLRFDFGSNNAW
jgi:2'-5' RNA ligase